MPEQQTTPQNSSVLVEIKDLRTYFFLAEGVVRAVDGVNLTVNRGVTMGIVGESGCGKSITAYSILRLVSPPGKIVGGDIFFYKVPKDGSSSQAEVINLAKVDPNGETIRNIRGNYISIVFQEPMTAMSPVRTVGQQIMEAIILHQKVDKKTAREMTIDILSRVRMSNPERVVDEYPFQLSGGMRQRAVIAMALSCRPQLLIADEPTTALDVTTEAQILKLMRELQEELGMGIMYITHNLGVIAEMAQEVAVMYLGRVVEKTDVKELFFHPLHPYTQALLTSIPQLRDALTRQEKSRLNVIKGMVPDPYTRLKGCPFHPRCPVMISGVCDEVEVPEIEAAPGHMVRCHLYTSH
ncbi:MAG TPA: dipeptide/oligopeptide/nickel ABC transporter ATP-binding protein [Anaerolinea thermolimosa]|uniref:Dipeptide/oligopeptide/nickel ABC transporter ATP-binding protein n=1 Tax=Anaerolinea thermolimosa TaxID=229919 RepID=A0A3D1JJ62_9CHLR|nr:dipeptide/oligopeptide/nickel ABC transporter ATP-binding protein [Anaerolinea thermolimosa]